MKKWMALLVTLVLTLSMLAMPAMAETELKMYLFGEAQNMPKACAT